MPNSKMVIALEERFTQNRGLFTCGKDTKPNGEACVVFSNAPRDLVSVFQIAIAANCSAVICSGEWGQYTTQMIFAQAAKLRLFLQQEFRVRTGDRIAISLCNRPEFIVALVAVTSLGATAVLINNCNGDYESNWTNETGCRLIISEMYALDEQAGNSEHGPVIISQILAGVPQHSRRLTEIVKGAKHEVLPLVPVAPDVDGVIAFTSDRSGRPKGAILTHRAIVTGVINAMLASELANAGSASSVFSLRRHLPTLLLSPLSHISGLSDFLQQALVGGRVVLRKSDVSGTVASLIQQEKVGSIVGVTAELANELVEAANCYDLSSLKNLYFGSAELPCELVHDLRKAVPSAIVSTSYGFNETAGVVCSMAGDGVLETPKTFGRVLPTVEIKITDSKQNRIEDGEVGEIWIRGAMLFRDYLAPYKAEFRDGWFNTGDTGFLTADRFLAIVDFAKY